MAGINTNVASLFAQNNLSKSGAALSTAIARLSSGLRVNSAKDDAAGLAISEKFRAQIGGFEVAKRNSNDGISSLEVAEGALGSVTDSLQRMRELAVQASTGTLTSADRDQLTEEYDALKSNVSSIIQNTNFNGIKLLTTTALDLDVQIGANSTDSLIVKLGDIEGAFNTFSTTTSSTTPNDANTTTLTLNDLKSTTANNLGGVVDGTAVLAADGDSSTFDLDGDGRADLRATRTGDGTATVNFLDRNGNTIGDAVTGVNTGAGSNDIGNIVLSGAGGLGVPNTLATGGTTSVKVGALSIQLVSNGTNFTDANYLSGAAIDGSDGTKARAAITKLDTFLNEVSKQRSVLGAGINRLDSVVANLDTSSTSLSAARGRIIDADFAKETANLTRAQILQQAGTSVLAQANQIPSGVLSLLR
ncbi:flagellin [Limnobacter humi]|uniref:Flagellin n=1 Tax=Limnobacter humi TaxID=1778671 RepID=A0ABT1WK95_9BURK|nr:flagellin [Limnobacter humi]MCQ8897531.1 flagellin [Limnobacter humi]